MHRLPQDLATLVLCADGFTLGLGTLRGCSFLHTLLRCVRLGSTRRLGFELASALCILQWVALYRRLGVQVHCYGLRAPERQFLSFTSRLVLSHVVSISLSLSLHYGARAASFKSPGGWVSCVFGTGAYPQSISTKSELLSSLPVPTRVDCVCQVLAQILSALAPCISDQLNMFADIGTVAQQMKSQ